MHIYTHIHACIYIYVENAHLKVHLKYVMKCTTWSNQPKECCWSDIRNYDYVGKICKVIKES